MTTYSPNNTGYFYSGQIRRFISQFIRLVSDLYVAYGQDATGVTSLQRVPVIYGDPNRQVSQIINNNSDNTLMAVPCMAVYVYDLKYDQSRTLDPTLVQSVNVRQRQFDPVTGTYTQLQGDAYTIDRLMATPWKMTLKLDIWTSNTEQKLQLIEQLAVMFNPAQEIQNTDNYFDWGSLSLALLADVNWTSRSVPTGTDEPIDISTFTFELPIYISSPAKVKKLGVVQAIFENLEDLATYAPLGQVSVTVLNYAVLLETTTVGTYQLRLLKPLDSQRPELGYGQAWAPYLEEFGTYVPGTSQIRLLQGNGSEIVGTIAPHPTDPTILLYNPFNDTLPANTLPAINAIIDPTTVNPMTIAGATIGTRYLILEAIGSSSNASGNGPAAWRGSNGVDLVAAANDIIEFNGTAWSVSFDSQNETTLQYVTNLTTGIQYTWTDGAWTKSQDGIYAGGEWSIVI